MRLKMSQSGENLKPVNAKPSGVLVPGHGAARLVDEKRHGVGIVDRERRVCADRTAVEMNRMEMTATVRAVTGCVILAPRHR